MENYSKILEENFPELKLSSRTDQKQRKTNLVNVEMQGQRS